MKKTFLLLAASLPVLGHSDDTCCTPSLLPPEPIESCELPVGYFWPAQFTFDCGWNLSFAGEFIYWELNRDSECILGTKSQFSNDGRENFEQILIHRQGYRPGFKVAMGMGLPGFDNWTFNAEYTWFHHKSTNFFSADGGFIIPSNFLIALDPALFFNSPAASLRSNLRFNLDFLTTTVGRPFYLSQRFMVDVQVGLKTWWSSLHTDLVFDLLSGLPGTTRTKSGLWGIGPYVSAEVKGLLWCGTYLYTQAGIWSPYTRFNKYHTETNFPGVGPIPALANLEHNQTFYYTTQLFYEGGAGLGWGTYFCDCSYHMDLIIGYEMMTTFVRGYALVTGSPHREFYYQGLTVKAQLDF